MWGEQINIMNHSVLINRYLYVVFFNKLNGNFEIFQYQERVKMKKKKWLAIFNSQNNGF